MSAWKKRISIAFGVYSAILVGAIATYLVVNRASIGEGDFGFANSLLTVASFSFLAAFLAYRRPNHKISWLLVVVSLLQQMRVPSEIVEIELLGGAQPTLGLLFWGGLWRQVGGMAYILLAYIFILFPDGRLPSPRFRLARWILFVLSAAAFGSFAYLRFDAARAFAEASVAGTQIVLTPVAGGPVGDLGPHVRRIPAIGRVNTLLFGSATVLILMGLLSQITRFRRGKSLERQQIKWAMFVMAVWFAGVLLLLLLPEIRPLLLLILTPLLPSGIAVPILRYRLWDIDLIIRRTLIYSLLTLTLGAVYFGSAVLLQQLFAGLTGGQSPVAIVVSTLLIAAFFTPLRRRAQKLVDRRFYRSKYDTARTLGRFAQAARDEVDLDQLTAELLHVIKETMQPESASLWLRRWKREEPPSLRQFGEGVKEGERGGLS
jgi:hypothetical protein